MTGTTGLALCDEGIGIAHCLRRPGRPPHLERCAFHSVPAMGRAKLLHTIFREHRLDRFPCVSVMEATGFTLLLVEAPQVEATELRPAVRWRIKDLLDFPLNEAVIDLFPVPDQQERGRPKLIYVVASRLATVRREIDLLEGSGARLKAIDIPELCQRNIGALLPEDPNGVALLHLSANRGLLTLTRAGSLYLSRALELGTEQLLAATGDGQKTPPELARLLDGVVLEVQRSLDYYESHYSLPPIAALVVAPLARPIPDLIGYLANNLGLPVRCLDINALLPTEHPLSDALQAACFPAIGAALRQEEKA